MAQHVITETRHLVDKIQADFFSESVKAQNFKYAGVLKAMPITEEKVFWVKRNASGGLIPVVSPDANSPMGIKGSYRGFEDTAIHFREIIPFSRDELMKIISNDVNIRIAAKVLIKEEMNEQLLRAMNTRELVAHSIIARGSLRYSSMVAGQAVQVNKTFPVKTRTVSSSWSNAAAPIVTDMDAFLNDYEDRVGSRPDFIRMTSRLFNDNVKKNTEVKGIYTTAFQMQKKVADLKSDIFGFLTPSQVSQANGWPPIELHNQKYHVEFTANAAATAGNNVRIDLKEGTWGLFVGGKVLIGFGIDAQGNTTWTEKQTILSIEHGKGISVRTLDANITADTKIAARPFFHPEDRILFGRNEQDSQFIEPAYGIDLVGDTPVLPDWRGIRTDAFMGVPEPNLAVYRRVMDSFGLMLSADNYESITVII